MRASNAFVLCLCLLLQFCKTNKTTSNLIPDTIGDDFSDATRTRASNNVVLRGRAFMIAPVRSAHVRAVRADAENTVLGEDVTDDNGEWSITFDGIDGTIVVELLGDRGGDCIEPATGVAPINLSQDDRLLTIVPNVQLGQERADIALNPWTTLVAVRAIQTRAPDEDLAVRWQHNVQLFSAHFGTGSPWDALPIDLAQTAAPGLSTNAIYSFLVFALSEHALELGRRAGVTDVSVVNTFSILRLLSADLRDGIFDGKAADVPLSSVAGNVRIDSETTRASLARSLEDFTLSTNNKSGLVARDLTKVLTAIRGDVSELYPPGAPAIDRDRTAEIGAPPTITIAGPVEQQIVGFNAKLTAQIFDADGIASASVTVDGLPVGITFDQSQATLWVVDQALPAVDGAHLLELSATDTAGNVAHSTVTFTSDLSPPAISYLSCHAPNDFVRDVTTSVSGPVFADTAPEETCLEAMLASGDQVFHSFSDLLSEGVDTPKISLAISDASELASVTCIPSINGVAGDSFPCPVDLEPATHSLTLQSGELGDWLITLAPSDLVSIKVIAIDVLGNTAERSFTFRVSVLPTPLHVAPSPLTPQHALTNYSFAADNIIQLMTASTFPDYRVHLNAYAITNVSPRATQLSLTDGLENTFAWWTRRAWVAPYRAVYPNFTVSDGAGRCANGLAMKFFRWGTVDGTTCVDPSLLARMTTAMTGHTPSSPYEVSPAVFSAAGTQLVPDANNEVTLEAGQTYRVIVRTRIPSFPYSDPGPRRCEATFQSEHDYHTPKGGAAQVGGLYKKQHFITHTREGWAYDDYGYLSCDSHMVSVYPMPSTLCSGTGICSFDALIINGAVYPVSYVVIERDLKFETRASWTPRIHLPTSTTTIPARPDRTGLAILQQYTTENSRPPAGRGFSVSGW